jgi:c(7)-type cytochrome triheme protein
MRRRIVSAACVALLFAGGAFAATGGGDIPIKNKGGEVLFRHGLHVDDAGIACQACHPDPFLSVKQHKKVTMKEMQQGKSCGACHDGKKAFSVKGDCSKCHKK